jgi:hypothetical protein
MSAISSPPAWQAGFLAVLPEIQSYARLKFRYLKPERRQDAIQEAVAAAYVSYCRLAVRGLLHLATIGSLVTFAVRHVRANRHVGGTQETLNDVLSPAAQRRHGIQNLTYRPKSSDAKCDDWLAETIADKKAKIIDLVWTKIDFAAWLSTLTRRDRQIVAALARHERTSDVAERFGLTRGRVSQLRRRYEWDWLRFQGEINQAA